MEQAIKKAIEGGYMKGLMPIEFNKHFAIWENSKNSLRVHVPLGEIREDSAFWQALGNAMDWPEDMDQSIERFNNGNKLQPNWRIYWHDYVDHLANGKDYESFFKELLK